MLTKTNYLKNESTKQNALENKIEKEDMHSNGSLNNNFTSNIIFKNEEPTIEISSKNLNNQMRETILNKINNLLLDFDGLDHRTGKEKSVFYKNSW